MLILARKLSEKIILTDTDTNEKIEVMVTRCGSENVRIGIEASHKWQIDRAEVARDREINGDRKNG